LSTGNGVRDALKEHDVAHAQRIAHRFFDAYPNMDMLFVLADGTVLTQLGCKSPPAKITEVPELGAVLQGEAFRGLIPHGCERPGPKVPPAYTIALPLEGGGAIVLCLPYSIELLEKATRKLHMELALLGIDHQPISNSKSFPPGGHLREAADLSVK